METFSGTPEPLRNHHEAPAGQLYGADVYRRERVASHLLGFHVASFRGDSLEVSLNYCSQNGGNLYRAPYYNRNLNIGPCINRSLGQSPLPNCMKFGLHREQCEVTLPNVGLSHRRSRNDRRKPPFDLPALSSGIGMMSPSIWQCRPWRAQPGLKPPEAWQFRR